jgi:hypothetical protein
MSDVLSRPMIALIMAAENRSLWVIYEHFEAEFNALRPSAIVFSTFYQ